MASLGIRANLEIYTSLIDACVQAGSQQWTQVGGAGRCAPGAAQVQRLHAVQHVFALQTPAQPMLNAWPSSCAHAHSHARSHPSHPTLSPQLAFDLFDQMRAQGLAPSAITYGCLLSACERSGNVDLGFELYKQACDEVRRCMR